NDILIDDIQFGSCDPEPVVSSTVTSGCLGSPANFTSTLSDPGALGGTVEYQWEVGTTAAGPWTTIGGATSANYTIASVTAGDVGKYYRVLIAASGNIGNANCRYASPGMLLVSRTPSVAPTGATVNKTNVCPGIAISLNVVGGSLGTSAVWRWYTASCGGTLVGTGATLNITAPSATTTYFVRAEGLCNTTTCQSVTVFVTCDIDKDNDGIPDYVESYAFPAALTNAYNTGYAGYKDNNHDFINDDFQADGDSDNDGIRNYLDATFPGRVDSNADGVDDRFDMDLDGVINMLDLDSDNDGIPDVVEAGGVDADGDGRIDNFTDTDGDGLSQNVDGNNTGAANSGNGLGAVNLDNDAYPNAIDRDSDGDGIPDVVEVYGPDANNNAVIDGFVDANTDGLHDAYINATALLRTGADTNGDGRADSYPNKNFDNDRRPNAYDIDSDGDGITDVMEAGFSDAADYNGFIDGPISADGWNTALHALPVLPLLNSENNGRPNYLDIDSDGDGIPDNIEGQTTLGYRLPTGLDNDNDGLDNAYDLAPWTAAFGGAGLFPPDKDGDTIPDYIDLDTDADGAMDITEGHDYNGNGIADENVTPMNVDTDGDGLDDRFDLINSTTTVKGTSILMGNGGSLTGDASPGTRATVQKFVASQPERDWRYVSYVLPVNYLHLTASQAKNNVSLFWGVMASVPLQSFEIQRSTDNVTFKPVATQQSNNVVDVRKDYTQYDDLSTINNAQVFYRIRVIAANGQEKYSNVVVVRKAVSQLPVTIVPNPAQHNASILFYTDQEVLATINLKDVTGRVVSTQKAKVFKGNNSLALSNLSKFSDGVYHVQLLIGSEVITTKLIIQN
ncbi:MAG: T9SS type A sorting domain-containing protein, partial [Sphingobacteriales bacterium]